jgi:FtsP/CotA-like multicopper oxidase with cupredoxin domain
MQSRAIGGVIAVGLVVVAVVLFVVLRDDGGDDETAATTATTTTQAEKKPKKKQKPEEPKPVTIVVEGGQPAGGIQQLEYTKGDTVQFQVRSDVAEEVHVHGYDIAEDVAPGQDAKFDFVADIDGGFEVELEGAHVQIAELTVEPG